MKKPSQYWDITINAFRGCSHISDGCKNCWAERFAVRHAANPKTKHLYEDLITNGKWNDKTFYDKNWDKRLPSKSKAILFNCMGDLFHIKNKTEDIIDCMDKIRKNDRHTFFIPTKRTDVAFGHFYSADCVGKKYKNIILLASVSNQKDVESFLPNLIKCKTFVAIGLSAEPLLEKIDISAYIKDLDWVSAGGETGQGARPCKAEWLEAIYSDCRKNRIPFFFKGGKNIDRKILLPREEIK